MSYTEICYVNFIGISFRTLLRAGREVNCISNLFKEFLLALESTQTNIIRWTPFISVT